MKRLYALSALLGAVLMLTYCVHFSPTSTINPKLTSTYVTSSTPDLGLHLLVDLKGDLSYKYPGWKEYLPLSFGTALNRGALLQAAPTAEGLVVCADLSLAPVPPGYDGGLPCPQAKPLLMRQGNPVVGPRRSMPSDFSIPYVLSPRNTWIQTARPMLRWHPSGTGPITYTIRVWGGEVEWQEETGFNKWNLYRGDLGVLIADGIYTQDPDSVPLAEQFCRLGVTSTGDEDDPAPGQTAFYLVTGVQGTSESSLGVNSSGHLRPNHNPCAGSLPSGSFSVFGR